MTTPIEEKIEQLFHLFETRADVILSVNVQLVELLYDTVIAAFVELVELPFSQVKWKDISLRENELVFLVDVIYSPENCPTILQQSHKNTDEDNINEIHKTVWIIIPVDKAFEPKEVLKQYLADAFMPPASAEDPPKQSIDLKLSRDQFRLMLYTQQHTLGTKQ